MALTSDMGIDNEADSGNANHLGETELRLIAHSLGERLKELNCLYGLSQLVQNRNLSIEDTLQSVVEVIPPAWQYPEDTCARIKLRSHKPKHFTTANFAESVWKQTENIMVNDRLYGTLDVCYLREKPESDEGPFLKEERNLLHVIAERLGHMIEHKQAEGKLQTLYRCEKELRQRLQVEIGRRADFTRKLIHELKTPLTSLLATSQLLTDETQGRLHKLAIYVQKSAESLNNRIQELHDVVRGELGKLELKLQSVDIHALMTSLVEETRALSRQEGMAVKLELAESLPKVKGDPDRIRQIMLNLINNAFRYAYEGKGVDIKVGAEPSIVLVEVRDYGPGISMQRQRRLFERDYQISSHTDSTGGLGVGLALCKMLVELQSGHIWLKSKVGHGSSFFFTLPVASSNSKTVQVEK